MPEGPELRLAAQFVNAVGARFTFGGPVVKSDLATKHQEVHFTSKAYTVSAQSRGKEIKVFLKPEDQKIESTCPKGQEPVRHLLFRFGMSGSFKFHKADEEEIPKHAHLRFTTKDQKYMLSFVDYRRFGRWHINENWGPDRGPDIIDEYNEYRAHVLDNLHKTDFDKAICEAMLNQKYFNGVGNYLRAEVLYRAGVPPFVKARDALQPLVEDEGGNGKVKAGKKEKAENDLLLLCNIVMREVMDLSANPYVEPGMDSTAGLYDQDSQKETTTFNDWLQCYYQDGMKNLVDRNGRTIWFSGEAGPMKPANGKSRSPVKKAKKRSQKDDQDHDYTSAEEKLPRVKSRIKTEPASVKKSATKQEIKEEQEENGLEYGKTQSAASKRQSKKKDGSKPAKNGTAKIKVENGVNFSPLKTRQQRKSR